ncbi:MAG: ABC transporter ATP-binding protein [Dehalococcoidia bacterium]|nr:ABC transporter ATP-binding protein [Dehalococcoidia bacterium]
MTVRGLRRTYGTFEAVRGLDLDIHRGEVFALLGPNGAGKTTTVEILEGYRPRSAGEVSVLGFDPALGERELRERVGIVLQETVADQYLTVREMVDMYQGYYPHPLDPGHALALVGLAEQASTRVRRLSGGQRRRLDVALGLIGDPDLLFLDEPTTGFDPNARRDAWDMIRGLRSLGKTVLLTTHYLDEAQQLADRVGIMARGRLIALGTPNELMGSGGAAIIEFDLEGAEGIEGAPGLLSQLPEDAIVENGRVVIHSTEPTRVLAPLVTWAAAQGRELPGLRVVRPSLEDVYLDLVRTAEEASA